mmetsp:Transcript_20408/g.43757  ORF Transcript_20408/g.43757 Transcript_20408/m.43757 type:complete len:388 (-) Transcript_20408:366-1529(-)
MNPYNSSPKPEPPPVGSADSDPQGANPRRASDSLADGDGGWQQRRRPSARRRATLDPRVCHSTTSLIVRQNSIRFRHDENLWYDDTSFSGSSVFSGGMEVMDLRPRGSVEELQLLDQLETEGLASLSSGSSSIRSGCNSSRNSNGKDVPTQSISRHADLSGLNKFFHVAGGVERFLPKHWKVDSSGNDRGKPQRRENLGGIGRDGSDGFSSESSGDSSVEASGSGSSDRDVSGSSSTSSSAQSDRSGTKDRWGCKLSSVLLWMALAASSILVYLVADENYKHMLSDGGLFRMLFGKLSTRGAEVPGVETISKLSYRKLPQRGSIVVLETSPNVSEEDDYSISKYDVSQPEIKLRVPITSKEERERKPKSDTSALERNRKEHLEGWKD